MKTCDYCGRKNADEASSCLECGTTEFKGSPRPGPPPPPENSPVLCGGLTGRWVVGPGPDAAAGPVAGYQKRTSFSGPAHIAAPRTPGQAGAWVYNSDSRGGSATIRFKGDNVTLRVGALVLKLLLALMMVPLAFGGAVILSDSGNNPQFASIAVLMLALAALFGWLLFRRGRKWCFPREHIANACLIYFPLRQAWGIQFIAGAAVANRDTFAPDPLSSSSLTIATVQLGRREMAQTVLERLPTRRVEVTDADQQERMHFERELKAAAARTWVTPGLIGANVMVFVGMIAASHGEQDWGRLALAWGANFGPLTLAGDLWRLLTCCFVHFGALHLGLNMWALWSAGRTVERLQGHVRFLVIYLASGVAASMASIGWNPFVVSAGASGAILGVYGALAGYMARQRRGIPSVVLRGVLSGLAAFILNNVVIAFSVRGIDHAAHLGGLAAGALFGFVAARPLEPAARARASRSSAVALAVAVATVAVLLSFRLMAARTLVSSEGGSGALVLPGSTTGTAARRDPSEK